MSCVECGDRWCAGRVMVTALQERRPAEWTAPSFLEAVTSGKVGTHDITETAPR